MKNEETKDLAVQGAENQEENFHGYEWLWDEYAKIELAKGDKSVVYTLNAYDWFSEYLREDINEDFPNGYCLMSYDGIPNEMLGDDSIPTETYWDIIHDVRACFKDNATKQAFSIYLSNNNVKPGDILSYIDSFRNDFFGKFETNAECAKALLCGGVFFEQIIDSRIRDIVIECFDFNKYYECYTSQEMWRDGEFYFWK